MGVIAVCLRYFEISQGRGKTTVVLVLRFVKIFGDTPLQLRDGPLEKLWGGRGIFELQEFFFRYQIPCMNFFQALA